MPNPELVFEIRPARGARVTQCYPQWATHPTLVTRAGYPPNPGYPSGLPSATQSGLPSATQSGLPKWLTNHARRRCSLAARRRPSARGAPAPRGTRSGSARPETFAVSRANSNSNFPAKSPVLPFLAREAPVEGVVHLARVLGAREDRVLEHGQKSLNNKYNFKNIRAFLYIHLKPCKDREISYLVFPSNIPWAHDH